MMGWENEYECVICIHEYENWGNNKYCRNCKYKYKD